MFPRWKNLPQLGARGLVRLLLAVAFVLALQFRAEAAGTFISAPSRVDMVYDSGRDTLYITSGANVLRYHLGTNSFQSPFNLGGSLAGLDLSPDGNTLVVADRTRTTTNTWVHVVNLTTGASSKALFPRSFQEGGTYTVAYGADNRVLVTSTIEGSGWGPLRRLDPATGAWIDLKSYFPGFPSEVRQNTMLAASGDRSVVGYAEADSSAGPLGRYRVSDSNIIQRTGYDYGTSWFNYEIGVNKNGTQYAVPTYGGTFIYNANVLKTSTVLGTYAGAQPIGVVYHPVEDLVYFPWTTTKQVRAFDTNTFAQVAAYDFEDTFQGNGNWAFQQGRMKMSRDGSLLFGTVTGGVRFVRLYAALTAEGQSVSTGENTPVNITLSGSVGNGGALSYRVVTQPAHGTLSGTGANLVYTPETNYEGNDSFTFRSVYGPAESAEATVNVNVSHGNDAPTADELSVTVDEGGSVAVTLTATDPEGAAVTFAVVTQPAYGTLSGTAPNLVYTPASDFYGSDSFAFTASDGANSATGHVYVTVNGVNDAPSVTNQSVETDEDTPLSITLTGTDIDSSSLSFMAFTSPLHGTLSGTMPNIVYTPDANYSGPDSFGFKATDGELDSNDATVTINVRSVNDAPVADAQTIEASEDTPASVTLSGSDAEGGFVTYAVVTQPAHGTLSGAAPNLVYTPASNYNGPDGFTFRVNDGAVNSSTATVSINVAAINDPPAGNPQSVTTKEDTAAAFTLTGSDPDGDTVIYQVVSAPAHGTLSGDAPNLTYTPDANYNGPDSFGFSVSDGVGESAPITVSINVTPVNDSPVPSDITLTTDEDTSVPATLSATDLDGDNLVYYLATVPSHGNLSGTAPNYTYNPLPNFSGTDTFTYRVNDGVGNPVMATVTVTVNPTEDAPVANRQNLTGTEDTSMSIVLTGSDPDGDALTYNVTVAPRNGTLSGTAPNLVYTPNANYSTTDDFAFTVSDGKNAPSTERVYIWLNGVNDAPTAVAQSYVVNEDSPRQTALNGYDVDNNPITYTVVTQPAHGMLSGTGWNLYYTPAPNYSGPDSFTFKVNDGTVDSNVATVHLNVVAANDAPTANAQTLATNEDTAKSLTLTGSDVDGDAVTYMLIGLPQHGSLTGTVPNLIYTPAPNYNGPDSFTFVAYDGKTQSALTTVSFNVASVNDAPVAVADTATVVRNATAVSLSVLANDSDVDGDVLTITSVAQPANGAVTIPAGGKSVSYTPRRNYRGNDLFTYTVSDGRGGTRTASVTIVVK
ncbi:MAG TPA: Ig-like domain-containing protein [Pyrinomonadaceae bacterium]